MKPGTTGLTLDQAKRLAKRGGFGESPSFKAPKFVRGAFGEALVKGWLSSLGYEIANRPLVIRAEDFGLEVPPSFRRYRLIEVVTSDENLAVEVKTYGTHSLQGSCDSLQDQLIDDLIWRERSPGRQLGLAIVHYFGRPSLTTQDLGFVKNNRIPVRRFVIKGMAGVR